MRVQLDVPMSAYLGLLIHLEISRERLDLAMEAAVAHRQRMGEQPVMAEEVSMEGMHASPLIPLAV